MSKKKKNDKKNEPPSLFDNLDLFAPIKGEEAPTGEERDRENKGANGANGHKGFNGDKVDNDL